MNNNSQKNGWDSLSEVSNFFSHVEQRKKLNIFGSLDAKLDYCEYLVRLVMNKNDIKSFSQKKRKKQLNQDLINALKSLKLNQLIYYYNIWIQQIFNLTNNINVFRKTQQPNAFLTAEAYSKTYNLRMWKKKKFRFDREKHLIYAEKDKKIKIYQLKNYILRSQEYSTYFILVLEAINSIPHQKSRTVIIGYQLQNIYKIWWKSIRQSIDITQYQSLFSLVDKKEIKINRQKNVLERNTNGTTTAQTPQMISSSDDIRNKELQQQAKDILKLQAKQKIQSLYEQNKSAQKQYQSMNKGPFSYDDESLILNSFVYRLIHQKLNISLEQLQLEFQIQPQNLKEHKRKMKFYKAFVQNVDIQSDYLQSIDSFSDIESQQSHEINIQSHYSIYQSKTEPDKLKLIYSRQINEEQSHLNTIDTLLQYFINCKETLYINQSIAKIKINNVIYSENSTIIQQRNVAFNRLFRPRDFVFLRHVFENSLNQKFIIDKSIMPQDFFPHNQGIIRGELQNIYKIFQEKGKIYLICEIKMDNRGQISYSQNIKMNKQYIYTLINGLQWFFSQKRYRSLNKIYLMENFNKSLLQARKEELDIMPAQKMQDKTQAKNRKRKKSSYYRLSRKQLFIKTPREFLDSQIQEEKFEMSPRQIRRNASNLHLSPQKSISKDIQDQDMDFGFNMTVEPPWIHQWQRDSNEGFFCKKVNKKKQELKKVFENIAKKILLGKKSSKISFPVDIQSPESYLQRLVHELSYAPSIFQDAYLLTAIQKFKKVVNFSLLTSLLSLYTNISFQPLLGQTYQSKMCSDCFGYAEQLSLFPPTSAILLVDESYSVSGILKPDLKVMMNSVCLKNEGTYKVTFQGKDEVIFTSPIKEYSGFMFNNIKFKLQGKSYYSMKQSNLILELNFQARNSFQHFSDKPNYFQGIIFQVTPSFFDTFIKEQRLPQQSDIVRKIEKVSGEWTEFISFQSQTVHFNRFELFQMTAQKISLPSDSTYRKDINDLLQNDLEEAQKHKLELQEQQQRDDTLRQEYE